MKHMDMISEVSESQTMLVAVMEMLTQLYFQLTYINLRADIGHRVELSGYSLLMNVIKGELLNIHHPCSVGIKKKAN